MTEYRNDNKVTMGHSSTNKPLHVLYIYDGSDLSLVTCALVGSAAKHPKITTVFS